MGPMLGTYCSVNLSVRLKIIMICNIYNLACLPILLSIFEPCNYTLSHLSHIKKKSYKIKSVLLVHAQKVFKFLGCLVKEKNKHVLQTTVLLWVSMRKWFHRSKLKLSFFYLLQKGSHYLRKKQRLYKSTVLFDFRTLTTIYHVTLSF